MRKILILALAVGIAGCSSGDQSSSALKPPPPPSSGGKGIPDPNLGSGQTSGGNSSAPSGAQ